jgi:hypothetical protein
VFAEAEHSAVPTVRNNKVIALSVVLGVISEDVMRLEAGYSEYEVIEVKTTRKVRCGFVRVR